MMKKSLLQQHPEKQQFLKFHITYLQFGSDIDSKGIQDTAELLRSFAGMLPIDRGSRNAGTINNIRIRGLNADSKLYKIIQ